MQHCRALVLSLGVCTGSVCDAAARVRKSVSRQQTVRERVESGAARTPSLPVKRASARSTALECELASSLSAASAPKVTFRSQT
eukprot:1508531-Rhodomonas_salina.1